MVTTDTLFHPTFVRPHLFEMPRVG
jgi:hypothetical protein